MPHPELQNKINQWDYIFAVDSFSTKMDLAYLKKFNVIVLESLPEISRYDEVKDDIRKMEQVLQKYVEEGGGLLITGQSREGIWSLEKDINELNLFLKPFNAEIIKEQVSEKNPTLRPTQPPLCQSELAWTNNIVEDQLTEGVRGLIYPATPWGNLFCYTTHPLKLSKDWKVLVKGSKSAFTYTKRFRERTKESTEKKGSCTSEPSLIAVRQFAKGRIALWPTMCTTIINDCYHDIWGSGLLMNGKNIQFPSDGEKIFANLFQWLSAPSKGKFGGYKPQPLNKQEKPLGLRRIHWDNIKPKKIDYPHLFKGLIGLKSTLTSGKATPKEMISAAKESGYNFVAFSEDLERLNEEKLNTLKNICKELSDDSFQAYPGFVYHDGSGNAWQTFADRLTWPEDNNWANKDLKSVISNNIFFRGCGLPPVIMLHPNKNPEKGCFQGNFRGIAVYTYDKNKLVDDATKLYQELQEDGFCLAPVVVNFVYSVEDIKNANAPEIMQTYVPWFSCKEVINALGEFYAIHQGNYIFQRPSFISSGPVIDSFRVVNFGTADLAVPDNDRFRLQLKVSSPIGLKEVLIYNGLKIWRRFLPAGKKSWTIQLDGFHDKNHSFTVVITDNNGGKAISANRRTCVQEMNLGRCMDNINPTVNGKYKALNIDSVRGIEYYKKRNYIRSSLPEIKDFQETQCYAIENDLLFSSRFGMIKNELLQHYYEPHHPYSRLAGDLPQKATPQNTLSGNIKTTLFTPWPDATKIFLIEGNFQVLKKMNLPAIGVAQSNWISDGKTFYMSSKDSDGLCFAPVPYKKTFKGSLNNAEYISYIAPSKGSGAIFPLCPDMSYKVMSRWAGKDASSVLITYLKSKNKELLKGDSLHYKYLAVMSKTKAVPDNSFAEVICNKMGLRGKTAYTVTPKIGKVLDNRFILRLEAESYGFAGKITEAKLPIRLPVFISGLNERWPAGILYKGRNQLFIPVYTIDQKRLQRYAKKVKRIYTDKVYRFGILDGIGILQIDTEIGNKDVYIGNLLVCDNPDIFLELEDVRPGKEKIAINNPTNNELTVTVSPGPGFNLLGDFAVKVNVPAGGFIKINPKNYSSSESKKDVYRKK